MQSHLHEEQHEHQHEQKQEHRHRHVAAGWADDAAAELLDLDAEVLHSYLSEATAWIHDLAADAAVRRILDLGSGTGTGTFALLDRYDGANAIALDISPHMLGHLMSKASTRGLAGRISTLRADLDTAWPAIDTVDLVWASASLHHMADPDRVLTQVFAALRPSGVLVVVEINSFPRFLPDDLGFGRPGLEARCHTVLAEERAAELPHLGSDWGSRLSAAGFTIQAERRFDINMTPPLPAATGRYAQASLRRVQTGLDGRMSADDLATLATIIESEGPAGILQRDDLTVRTTRTVWVARRP